MKGEHYKHSVFSKIFLLMLGCTVGPLLLVGLYEFIIYHQVIYGKDNPLMMVLGLSILLSIIVAGFIAQDIMAPIQVLWQNIKNYREKKLSPLFDKGRDDEFGDLFKEYENLIKEIEIYQRESTKNARLAAIGMTTSMIAHDVRRPLASIKALLHALPSIRDQPSKINQLVSVIDRDIERTSNLLNEILEISRDSADLSLKEYCLPCLITTALSEVLQRYVNYSVRIEYEFEHDNLSAYVDQARIIRVLANIIENSIEAMVAKKTSCENILIFRTSLYVEDNKKFIALKIIDSGPGIPETILKNLFEPFVTHGKERGTGLGLTICQKIIEMHGGGITAENKEDEGGAIFALKLPAGEATQESFHSELIYHSQELQIFQEEEKERIEYSFTENTADFMRLNKNRGKKSTLLIVDDEPLFREIIQLLLNELVQVRDHVETLEAKSAEEGLEILKTHTIDYIITDIEFGAYCMNGYQLSQKVLSEQKGLFLLIHSNKRREEEDNHLRRLENQCFLGFVPKPMQKEHLLQFLAGKPFEKRLLAVSRCQKMKSINQHKHILLLNDDEIFNLNLKLALMNTSYKIIAKTKSQEALAYLQKNKIDAVISDINLGKNEIDGYDFLRQVSMLNQHIPRIIISGYAERENIEKVKSLAVTAYLQIPFETKDLIMLLDREIS